MFLHHMTILIFYINMFRVSKNCTMIWTGVQVMHKCCYVVSRAALTIRSLSSSLTPWQGKVMKEGPRFYMNVWSVGVQSWCSSHDIFCVLLIESQVCFNLMLWRFVGGWCRLKAKQRLTNIKMLCLPMMLCSTPRIQPSKWARPMRVPLFVAKRNICDM